MQCGYNETTMKAYNPHNHPCHRYCGQTSSLCMREFSAGWTKGYLRETCARYYNPSLAAAPVDAPQGIQERHNLQLQIWLQTCPLSGYNRTYCNMQHQHRRYTYLKGIAIFIFNEVISWSQTLIAPCNINERLYTGHKYLMMVFIIWCE